MDIFKFQILRKSCVQAHLCAPVHECKRDAKSFSAVDQSMNSTKKLSWSSLFTYTRLHILILIILDSRRPKNNQYLSPSYSFTFIWTFTICDFVISGSTVFLNCCKKGEIIYTKKFSLLL